MISGVRQFKFINGSGEEYDATRPEALLWQPDGLGWGMIPTVVEAGKGLITTRVDAERTTPSGTMVFRTYEEYSVFLRFAQKGNLVFAYKPLNVWVYIDCYISIGKGEIDYNNGHLLCLVQIHPTSGWYERVQAYQLNTGDLGNGKEYPYSYPYTYADAATGSVEIENGELVSNMKITIFGPCRNPFYALYKDGARTKTGKINMDLQAGRKLVIDSNPQTMQIAEYTKDGDLVANRYSASDFTTERIFSLPPGRSRMTFRQDGSAPMNVYVEVRKSV